MAWFGSPIAIALGFIATAVGLPISLLGFYLTLKQLVAVKSASEAASEAVSGIKLRFQHFDVIQECTRAEAALQDLRTVAYSEPELIIDACSRLATALVNIAESYPEVGDNLKTAIEEAAKRATLIAKSQGQGDQDSTNRRAKVQGSILEIHRTLVRVRTQIQREQ